MNKEKMTQKEYDDYIKKQISYKNHLKKLDEEKESLCCKLRAELNKIDTTKVQEFKTEYVFDSSPVYYYYMFGFYYMKDGIVKTLVGVDEKENEKKTKKKRHREIYVNRCKDISEIDDNAIISESVFFTQRINNYDYLIDAVFDNISKYWYIRMNKIIYNEKHVDAYENKEVIDLVYEKFNLKSQQLSLYDSWFDI